MKKSIMTAAAALCLGIACSCSEEDYKTVDPSAGNILEMTASGTEIKLDEKKADSEALALNWTTGSNKGTGNAITYTFEMALKDSDYSSGYKEELGRKAYSKTWTAKALNDFLKSNFGAQSGVISNTKGNGEQLIGTPAIDPKVFFKAQAIVKKLPDIYRELGMLRKEIEELKKR